MERRSFNRFLTVIMTALLAASGCPLGTATDDPINPFRDLPAIGFNAEPRDVTEPIVPLGELDVGDEIVLGVFGERVDTFLLLAEDPEFDDVGRIAGGGEPNELVPFQIRERGRYFAFVQFEARTLNVQRHAQIVFNRGEGGDEPPARQAVVIQFEEGWLTDPGLWDEDFGTPRERELLEEITETVRRGILDRLETIFDSYPVDIFDEEEGLPSEPFSTVTFSPRRVTADDFKEACGGQDSPDLAKPPNSDFPPECEVSVVFGEVLNCGQQSDASNRVLDDDAVVYVGSFQGRGTECRFAVINSTNNIILALARTAAHEIGHLVGLYHVSLADIMQRAPTLSVQRELIFKRGQLVVDSGGRFIVLKTILQDPCFYFQVNFNDECDDAD